MQAPRHDDAAVGKLVPLVVLNMGPIWHHELRSKSSKMSIYFYICGSYIRKPKKGGQMKPHRRQVAVGRYAAIGWKFRQRDGNAAGMDAIQQE